MLRYLTILPLLFLFSTSAVAEIKPDFLMDTDPTFQALPLRKDFQRDFKGVWSQALRRPEADYQRRAAETIARAHEYGIPGLTSLTPDLETILTSPTSHPSARFAAAHALIVLDSRNSADKLWEAGLNHGADLRQLTEPTMAKWNHALAKEIWKQRLQAPRTFPRDLILALRGLAEVKDESSVEMMMPIVTDPLRPSDIRLEAAQSAGTIKDSGLEADAGRLVNDARGNRLVNRLCAVRLLAKHSSDSAQKSLLELAREPDAAVASAAMNRLIELDPHLVFPIVNDAMANLDPRVRKAATVAYLKVPTAEFVRPLAKMLSDDHPDVRTFVAEGLLEWTSHSELMPLIATEALAILAADRWQGQTQATMLLGAMEHRPAADLMVQRLTSDHPEVATRAAWGLRKLAVPETIPVVVSRAIELSKERNKRVIPKVDDQVAHLIEACGVMQVHDVEPLLIKLVPKDVTRTLDLTRGAAIWALGRLKEGKPDSKLADDLIGRIQDDSPKPPESLTVKQAAAVAVGRMGAKEFAPALKNSLGINVPGSEVDLATRWAFQEITGETLPPPVPRKVPDGHWFLEPFE